MQENRWVLGGKEVGMAVLLSIKTMSLVTDELRYCIREGIA